MSFQDALINNFNLMQISNEFLVLVPVIVGFVEVVKQATGLNTRFAPLLAIVAGIGGAMGLSGFTFPIALGGLVAGLTACGLYAAGKTTLS